MRIVLAIMQNQYINETSAHSRPSVIALYIISSMTSQCRDYVSESPARAPPRARGEVTLFIAGRLADVLWWNFLWILGVSLSAFKLLRMLAIEEGLRKHSDTISVILRCSPCGDSDCMAVFTGCLDVGVV